MIGAYDADLSFICEKAKKGARSNIKVTHDAVGISYQTFSVSFIEKNTRLPAEVTALPWVSSVITSITLCKPPRKAHSCTIINRSFRMPLGRARNNAGETSTPHFEVHESIIFHQKKACINLQAQPTNSEPLTTSQRNPTAIVLLGETETTSVCGDESPLSGLRIASQ